MTQVIKSSKSETLQPMAVRDNKTSAVELQAHSNAGDQDTPGAKDSILVVFECPVCKANSLN